MPTDAEGGNWPDEYFLDGPAPGGDELLKRALTRVRRTSTRSARLRGVLTLAALLLATAMLTSAGMAIGRWSAQPPRVVTEVSAGATLQVSMVPAEGGSYLNIRVNGLPPGTGCWLTVTGKDGSRLADGSWQVGPDDRHQPPVDISIWLPPADVSSVDVTASTGAELTAPVR